MKINRGQASAAPGAKSLMTFDLYLLCCCRETIRCLLFTSVHGVVMYVKISLFLFFAIFFLYHNILLKTLLYMYRL